MYMLHLAQKPLNLKVLQIVLNIFIPQVKHLSSDVWLWTNIFVVFCSIIVFMFIEHTDTLIFLAFEVK